MELFASIYFTTSRVCIHLKLVLDKYRIDVYSVQIVIGNEEVFFL